MHYLDYWIKKKNVSAFVQISYAISAISIRKEKIAIYDQLFAETSFYETDCLSQKHFINNPHYF